MPNTETVVTSALRPGDIVFCHGMAVLLGERHESTSHSVPGVLWFDGDVLNRAEIEKAARDGGFCDAAFILASLSNGRGWLIQGNDHATWCRARRS